MTNFDRLRMRVTYKGLDGLSACGFRSREVPLGELFPTADEVVLTMAGCFHKLGEAATVIYEVPDKRFDVASTDGVLDLAVSNPKGDHIGVIIDVLALDIHAAEGMMDDVTETCEIVPIKLSDAMGIMDIEEEDYLDRLRDSMRLLHTELRR